MTMGSGRANLVLLCAILCATAQTAQASGGLLILVSDEVVVPLMGHHDYTNCGDRFTIVRCGGNTDDSYCEVLYPDRPKRGGFTYQTAETRGKLIKRLQACGQLPAAAQAAASAPRTAPVSANPTGQAQQTKQNSCDGGVDSNKCVSCAGKDCKIGDVSAASQTGIATIVAGSQRINVSPLNGDGLLKVENSAEGQYILYYRPAHTQNGDSSRICTVVVTELDHVNSPDEALALLEKFDPAAHIGALIGRSQFKFGDYTGFDSLVNRKDGIFSLMRDIVFKDVYLDKSCEYGAQPAATDAHWNQLRMTLTPISSQAN